MPIPSGDPAAAGADLNAALDALQAAVATAQPAEPAVLPEQQAFAAFFHS